MIITYTVGFALPRHFPFYKMVKFEMGFENGEITCRMSSRSHNINSVRTVAGVSLSRVDDTDVEMFAIVQIQSLTEERESLLFEKTVNTQTSTEEKEKLLCRVSSLSEERDQLQETLQVVRQEKNQLKAELEHKTEMVKI